MIFSVLQLQEKLREHKQPRFCFGKGVCPPILLPLVKSFHNGTKGQVQFDGDVPLSFLIGKLNGTAMGKAGLCIGSTLVWELLCLCI